MAQQRIESNERPALLQLQRLDQHQLRAEELQLHEHQQQLQALRGEAEGLKRQLAALPAIATEQVHQLRQAEQALAQTEARCQAMAASLEVLQADEPIRLDGGTPLKPGERYQLTAEVNLQVGPGGVMRLNPGGTRLCPRPRLNSCAAASTSGASRPSSEWPRAMPPKQSNANGAIWTRSSPPCARQQPPFPGLGGQPGH